jgi:hypothetical protein
MKKIITFLIIIGLLVLATAGSLAVQKYFGMTQGEKQALYEKLKQETAQKQSDFEQLDSKSVQTGNKDDILKAQKAGTDFKNTANELGDIATEIGAFDYDEALTSLIHTTSVGLEDARFQGSSQDPNSAYVQCIENKQKICDKYLALQKEKKIPAKALYENMQKELDAENKLLFERLKAKN